MFDRARFLFAATAVAIAAHGSADLEVLHREKSLYQTLLITREPSRLCLRFALRDAMRNQSCVDPEDPRRMVLPYARMMMATLLLDPSPKRMLVVGLGGGTLPTAFARLLPKVEVDVVEIDPAVVAAARQYFGFDATDRLRVHVSDARVFVKRALASSARRYDAILLDAYGGDYIPEHLMTVEFLREVRGLLAPSGVLAANTFATSRLYDHESQTYREAFGEFFNFKTPASGNRIVLAQLGELPAANLLRDRAGRWEARLRPYGVPIRTYPARMSMKADWDASKRALTDQYSPANLLRTE